VSSGFPSDGRFRAAKRRANVGFGERGALSCCLARELAAGRARSSRHRPLTGTSASLGSRRSRGGLGPQAGRRARGPRCRRYGRSSSARWRGFRAGPGHAGRTAASRRHIEGPFDTFVLLGSYVGREVRARFVRKGVLAKRQDYWPPPGPPRAREFALTKPPTPPGLVLADAAARRHHAPLLRSEGGRCPTTGSRAAFEKDPETQQAHRPRRTKLSLLGHTSVH